MTVAAQSITALPPGLSTGTDPSAMAGIMQPTCAAALWQRQMPDGVRGWLAALDPACLPSGRVILPPRAVASALRELCDIAGLPAGPERDWLEADIADLAETFAALMRARFLRLRLDVVTTNACRRFHVDAIMARLICTYRGTGTQYGTPAADGTPREIHTVRTGAPFLMRGTLWPIEPAARLVHRSPPIEGTGETRLVLVLDPVDDPDDAP